MADGPVTLRMGAAPAVAASPIVNVPAAPPASGTRKRGRKSRAEMTRGEKAAATRRARKLAAQQPGAVVARKPRRPANWDQMSRGEKMQWGKRAKARAEKRAAASAATVQVAAPVAVQSAPRTRRAPSARGASKSGKRAVRHPAGWDQMSRGEKASWTRAHNARAAKRGGAGRGRRVTRESARGIHKRVAGERMSHDEAMRRLERIRQEDPKLAELMEQEVEARAARVGAQGSKSKSAVVDGLAAGYVSGPGDIVREGSVGGRVLDGSIVVGSALLTVRLDEMIQARPLGLKPSTIKAILEALVLGVALLKRSRTVTRYAALSAAGTVSGMLVSAAVRRSAPTS